MKKRKAKNEWVTIPLKSHAEWFSEWLVSSMILQGLAVTGKLPKRIRLHEKCLKELPDGSGLLSFDVDVD